MYKNIVEPGDRMAFTGQFKYVEVEGKFNEDGT